MKCKICQGEVKKHWGNMEIKRDSITITLVETPFYPCLNCQEVTFPQEVEVLISKLLEEKKKFPDSPPELYVHVAQVLPKLRTLL
ncbi:MAG: hypothetical protein ACH0QD_13320 [Tepidibacillus sp.]